MCRVIGWCVSQHLPHDGCSSIYPFSRLPQAKLMNIETITLTDLEKLHLVFRGYRSHDGFGWWFRGQADAAWDLLPRAGRREFYLPDNRDLGRFNAWRNQAVAYCALPEGELEQLALAQHHGLATRLLDWSKNPLVACYFACSEQLNRDGAVYIYEIPGLLCTGRQSLESIKNERGVFGYIPNSISPRVLNQKGLFTVHCQAQQVIEIKESMLGNNNPNLLRLVIPHKLKPDVIKLLGDYGIDRSVLFPDLDGLSAHVNSRTADMRK